MDARLIGRYFGSKEGLFAEVVDLAYAKSLMMTNERRSGPGAADRPGPDGLRRAAAHLRSAANPQAAAITRNRLEHDYQRRLAEALPGERSDGRPALLVAICSGVLLTRLVLGNTQLNQPEAEELIPLLHRALDAVATAPGEDTA